MLSIQVDLSDIERLIQKEIPIAIFQSFQTAANFLDDVGHIIMAEVLEDAMASAGNAWPVAYIPQVIETSARVPVVVLVELNRLNISINLDNLGTKEELEMGYHFHAAMEGGGSVELPYLEQPLANEDVETRYEYWKKKVWRDGAPAGLYDLTMDARTTLWSRMKKAPQWLILQYGTAYEPVIVPYPVEEEIYRRLAVTSEAILAAFADTAITQISSGRRVSLGDEFKFELSGKGSKITGARGRFVRSPYKDYKID